MDQNNYKIDIVSSTEDGGSGYKSTNFQEKNTQSSVSDYARQAIKQGKQLLGGSIVLGTAMQVIDYTTSRVGITTGNYQRQQEINAGKTVLRQLGALGTGFAAGGVLGLVGAGVGIGVSYYEAYDSYNFSRKAEAATLAIRREREGLISVSRSRGAVQ